MSSRFQFVFQYTDQKISVLKVNPTDSSEKPHAELSIGYKIYQLAHHNAGKVLNQFLP